MLTAVDGEVLLDGTNLRSLSRKEVARSIAVVPQYFHMPFAFTVNEIVMLGRTPFIRALSVGSNPITRSIKLVISVGAQAMMKAAVS